MRFYKAKVDELFNYTNMCISAEKDGTIKTLKFCNVWKLRYFVYKYFSQPFNKTVFNKQYENKTLKRVCITFKIVCLMIQKI